MKKLIIVLLVVFCQCQSSVGPANELIGEWKIDSMYNYTNGFGFTNRVPTDDWSTFQYEPGGRMAEKRYGQQMHYQYRLLPTDSLVYMDSTGHFLSGFKILKLDEQHLVLKKTHRPFLPGKHQQLYEVRFFSKVRPERTDANSRL